MKPLKIEKDGKNTSIHLEEYLNMVYRAFTTLNVNDRAGTSRAKLMDFIKKQYEPKGLGRMVDANIVRAITYGVKHHIFVEAKPYGIKTFYKLAAPKRRGIKTVKEDGFSADENQQQ